MRGDGFTYQRHAGTCPNKGRPRSEQQDCSCVWWLAYYFRGEFIREPAGGPDGPPVRDAREARRRLRDRINAIRGGRYRGPDEERITVGDLLDALSTHLELKGARSTSNASQIATARRYFGLDRAVSLTPTRIKRYQAEELRAGKAPATINRIVGMVRQAYHLARKEERLTRVPYFPMLSEKGNERTGFVEPEVFEAIAAALPEDLADAARFAYRSGWRKGQIAQLRWEHVDRANRLLAVPGTLTKNGKPHTIALEGELLSLIERRWSRREVRRTKRPVYLSPYVFHRGDGKQLGDIRKTWAKACAAAGVPKLLFHDLRRSAARNLVRAGVDRDVAQRIIGHRTPSMFTRYNITDAEDQREALRRVDLYAAARREKVAPNPHRTLTLEAVRDA